MKKGKEPRSTHFRSERPGGLWGGGSKKGSAKKIKMDTPWHNTKPVSLRKLRDR